MTGTTDVVEARLRAGGARALAPEDEGFTEQLEMCSPAVRCAPDAVAAASHPGDVLAAVRAAESLHRPVAVLGLGTITVTAQIHSGLFWALRGGEGDFGVATTVTGDLFSHREFYGRSLYLGGPATPGLLSSLSRTGPRAAGDCDHLGGTLRSPGERALPELIRDRVVMHVRCAALPSAADGEDMPSVHARPLTTFSSPVPRTLSWSRLFCLHSCGAILPRCGPCHPVAIVVLPANHGRRYVVVHVMDGRRTVRGRAVALPPVPMATLAWEHHDRRLGDVRCGTRGGEHEVDPGSGSPDDEEQIRSPRGGARWATAVLWGHRFGFLITSVLAGWGVYHLVLEEVDDDGRLPWLFLPLWVLSAYVFLPRLNRVLTGIYVPSYFIGRARTSDGLLGDPVNLAVVGTPARLSAAMVGAGWTAADPLTLRTGWHIVRAFVFRRSYPAAPVSSLFAFGCRQSLAFEREVAGNPAQRHHVRFWICPPGWRLPGGYAVDLIGAATFDRRVGLSLFTLQITHKIAADTDRERDLVVSSLHSVGATVRVVQQYSTGYHARNGGGDAIETDGNLPIIDVRPSGAPRGGPDGG